MMMRTFFLAALLALLSTGRAVAQMPAVQPPDHPGVFAVTDRGRIELTGFGERQSVESAIDTFAFAQSALDQIPVVSSVRSFYVNMLGWVPKDLYLLAGSKRLRTPRDDYRRLNGRAYRLGPVLFEIVTEALEPGALEKQYRSLVKKQRHGEDLNAFVVLETVSQSGLNRRSYPIQIQIQADPESTPPRR